MREIRSALIVILGVPLSFVVFWGGASRAIEGRSFLLVFFDYQLIISMFKKLLLFQQKGSFSRLVSRGAELS